MIAAVAIRRGAFAAVAMILGLLACSARADVEFDTCMDGLREAATTKGVSRDAFDAFTKGVEPDMSVVSKLDTQPEFVTPIWDYMAGLVDDQRVADGRAMLAKWSSTLDQVEARFGVDKAVVVAVWGIESNYGRNYGKRPLVQSLATLSCFGRRQDYFRSEFLAALQILNRGDVVEDKLNGSWAGAFGQTQFMPSTYLRTAVDFDGDGRRDLVDSVPDALASTANFLADAGWRRGQPWGYEVKLPDGFDASLAGRRNKRSVADWLKLGVSSVDGGSLGAEDVSAAIILPAGIDGPAFMTFGNFDAIYRYNASISYTLAIAHLADRIKGGGDFVHPWPTDDPGLSRAQRRELQTLLLAHGHDIGEPDGIIGSRTRAAIVEEQQALGLDANGRAGQKILDALRAEVLPSGKN